MHELRLGIRQRYLRVNREGKEVVGKGWLGGGGGNGGGGGVEAGTTLSVTPPSLSQC